MEPAWDCTPPPHSVSVLPHPLPKCAFTHPQMWPYKDLQLFLGTSPTLSHLNIPCPHGKTHRQAACQALLLSCPWHWVGPVQKPWGTEEFQNPGLFGF